MNKAMEKKIGLPGLLLIAALLLTACGASEAGITVETTEFEFGDVKAGELVSRDLVVTNTGSATLLIENISTSCGCTTAVLDRMSIPSGESTILHITFDSGAHGDLIGFVTRQVFIASNDLDQPEVRIQFSANVINAIDP